MLFQRTDGRRVRSVDPFDKMIPCIMRRRCDAQNCISWELPCAGIDDSIAKKKEESVTRSYTRIVMAGGGPAAGAAAPTQPVHHERRHLRPQRHPHRAVGPAVAAGGDTFKTKKVLPFGLTMDGRLCDGLYFARSMKLPQKFVSRPSLLETPLENGSLTTGKPLGQRGGKAALKKDFFGRETCQIPKKH